MMTPAEPLVFGKYSDNQDGKVLALRSIEANVDVLRTADEDD
jgi:hypothetical protein